jgi:dTDP-4-dehydrorhamnose reductase
MSPSAPVAVTGARGRLGRAVVAEFQRRGQETIEWSRPEYDLDDENGAERLVERDRPRLVVHCAAWTDVDGCAHDPALAMRRNATAVGELARACSAAGVSLVVVSTNEVFDGARTDGQGYTEDDAVNPPNPYGASKLAGEHAARDAFARRDGGSLWIIRTAWLFGPPGNDFPSKIVAAADRLPTGEPLRVVADEVGSPTFAPDLAGAMADLVAAAPSGIYHLAGAGIASRHDFALAVVDRCRPDRPVAPISRTEFVRASAAPPWAVLDCSKAASFGVLLRPWAAAVAEYLSVTC